MGRVTLQKFSGIAPLIPARSLANGLAQQARNCDLSVPVELKPIRGNRYIEDLPTGGSGSVQTLYLFDRQHWFTFYSDADVVRGPLPEDDSIRTYITDGGYPKVTRKDLAVSASGSLPAATYRLGVPRPDVAPVVTVSGAGDGVSDPYTTSYVQTFVTQWGEEGPPGDATDLRDILPGQTVTLDLASPPSGAWPWQSTRIYRLNTGTTNSDYQFVTELNFPAAQFVDTVLNSELAETIPSETWYAPPDESHPTGPLLGITSMANGSLAGFTGSTLCLSLPYLPHAFPYEARYTLTDNIVGLATLPAGLLVMTDRTPFLATGTSPESLSFSRMPENQACASKRSIVDMGGYTLYASPEGLVACDGASAPVVTQALFAEEDWRARFNPSSISGYYWEGRYVGFYDNGSVRGGFIYDPRDGAAAFSLIDLYADAGFFDPVADRLYLNVDDELVVFSDPAEPYRSMVWESGVATATVPTSYGALRLCGRGTGTAKVYADGTLVSTLPFTNPPTGYSTFRLPSGFRAREWSVAVEGTFAVLQIDLATSVQELRD